MPESHAFLLKRPQHSELKVILKFRSSQYMFALSKIAMLNNIKTRKEK